MSNVTPIKPVTKLKRLAFFERYLTVWVFLCMITVSCSANSRRHSPLP